MVPRSIPPPEPSNHGTPRSPQASSQLPVPLMGSMWAATSPRSGTPTASTLPRRIEPQAPSCRGRPAAPVRTARTSAMCGTSWPLQTPSTWLRGDQADASFRWTRGPAFSVGGSARTATSPPYFETAQNSTPPDTSRTQSPVFPGRELWSWMPAPERFCRTSAHGFWEVLGSGSCCSTTARCGPVASSRRSAHRPSASMCRSLWWPTHRI